MPCQKNRTHPLTPLPRAESSLKPTKQGCAFAPRRKSCAIIGTLVRKFGEILYCNDGDWVESCTALVEHFDGRLEILEWTDNTSPGVKASAEQPAMVQAI